MENYVFFMWALQSVGLAMNHSIFSNFFLLFPFMEVDFKQAF